MIRARLGNDFEGLGIADRDRAECENPLIFLKKIRSGMSGFVAMSKISVMIAFKIEKISASANPGIPGGYRVRGSPALSGEQPAILREPL
jgi:hypothetical protein